MPSDFTADTPPIELRCRGCRMFLRALRPADAGPLMEFFASHTPETIHQRYGYMFTEMTPERAARLVGVDQNRDVALGIFEPAESGRAPLIAVGRYCLTADGRSAEAAFVVHEERRRLHLATTLLAALIIIARARGLTRIVAQVQRDNAAMLAVFRQAGAVIESEMADGLMLSVPLQHRSGDVPCECSARARKKPLAPRRRAHAGRTRAR